MKNIKSKGSLFLFWSSIIRKKWEIMFSEWRKIVNSFWYFKKWMCEIREQFQKIANVKLFQYFSIAFTSIDISKTKCLKLIADIYSLAIIDSLRKDYVAKIHSFWMAEKWKFMRPNLLVGIKTVIHYGTVCFFKQGRDKHFHEDTIT